MTNLIIYRDKLSKSFENQVMATYDVGLSLNWMAN